MLQQLKGAKTITVQDLTNGKDIIVVNGLKGLYDWQDPTYEYVEVERIGSQAWLYVRKHTAKSLAKLHIYA